MLRSNLISMIIRPIRRFGLVIAATVLVAGCASTSARHQVMVFHDWPAGLSERTFRFAQTSADEDDLKKRTWRNVVRQELLAAGFVDSTTPALEIDFNFQTRERKVAYRHHAPYFTPYFSFGHAFRWGGLSISGPLWGWHGYSRPSVSSVYEHELNLTMKALRPDKAVKVFEGSSVTRDNGVPSVQALPFLTRAILKDFPGESGVSRTIDVDTAATTGSK